MHSRRIVRDAIIGIALGACIGIAIAAWAANSDEDSPTLDSVSAATTATGAGDAGGRRVTGATGTNTGQRPPVAPITAGERQLARVWEPVSQLETQGETYAAVTLEALGRQLPDTAFLPGNRQSEHPREISVSITNPKAITLAVIEEQQCVWLRDIGQGPELARATLAEHLCRADASPTTAVWDFFAPA